MDNYFVKLTRDVSFDAADVLYEAPDTYVCNLAGADRGSPGPCAVLHSSGAALDLPFPVAVFRDLQYDFLLLSRDQALYRVNKHRRAVEEIGRLHDAVLGIYPGGDLFLVLTTKELLLFNGYFELLESLDIRSAVSSHKLGRSTAGKQCCRESRAGCSCDAIESAVDKVLPGVATLCLSSGFTEAVWAGDLIMLIGADESVVLDAKLAILTVISERISSAVYISRYNKFACAVGGAIRFIEPNGLEHGDALEVRADRLASMEVDGEHLLVVAASTAGSESVRDGPAAQSTAVYFMKNFCWYRKAVVRTGRLLKAAGNLLITTTGSSVRLHYLYREMSCGLVVDGNRLLYTNFSSAIIPPPLYYKELTVGDSSDAQIDALCLRPIPCSSEAPSYAAQLYIASGPSIYSFSIVDDSIRPAGVTSLKDISDSVSDLLAVERSGQPLLFVRANNSIYEVAGHPDAAPVLCQNADASHGSMLKMFSAGSSYGILYDTGKLVLVPERPDEKTPVYAFKFDRSKNFKAEFCNSSLILQNGNELQILYDCNTDLKEPVLVPFVCSFITHGRYIIYVSRDKLLVSLDGQQCYEAYADAPMQLLAVLDSRIISQTRFGSLETTTCKVFVRQQVEDALSAADYRAAADICDAHHISYAVFYRGGRCPLSAVAQLSDSQARALLGQLRFSGRVLHEHDSLERLRQHARASGCAELFLEGSSKNGAGCACRSFLGSAAAAHLLQTAYHAPLFSVEAVTGDAEKCTASSLDCIDLDDPVATANALLPLLSYKTHRGSIIALFAAMQRIDLCFFLPDLAGVVSSLRTTYSDHEILCASVASLDPDRIALAHRICQADYAPFRKSFESREDVHFFLYNHLEDREKALYYLVKRSHGGSAPKHSIDGSVASYAEKHGLLNELVMYQYYGLFETNFYPFVAAHAPPAQALALYHRGGSRAEALAVAKQHLLWREALELSASDGAVSPDERVRIAQDFAELLLSKERPSDAGAVYEDYLKQHDAAIRCYIQGDSYKEALALYKRTYCNGEPTDSGKKAELTGLFASTARSYLQGQIIKLRSFVECYDKYRHRIYNVREKLSSNIGMSQSTFTCTSSKSLKNALTKDRPGGLFEYEYVLNRIRLAVLDIVAWQRQAAALAGVFGAFEMGDCAAAQEEALRAIAPRLRAEVDEIWSYKRDSADAGAPEIARPELPAHFG
ncbi:hypothetical protein PAPHI01_2061 [Pancytospora philotis]|nr:hypothetical protein PAPHI01_2061 [Pancytospora philotis]